MKKFLSLFLALVMAMSLCACGGGGDAPVASASGSQGAVSSSADGSQPAGSEGEGETDAVQSEAPKKVIGERVPIGGGSVAQGVKYMPTNWELGPVDPAELITPERLPLDEKNMKMVIQGNMGEDASMSMTIAVKGDKGLFEMETINGDISILSRFFNQGEETYLYCKQSEGTVSEEGLFHVLEPEKDEEEPSEAPIEEGEPADAGGTEGGLEFYDDSDISIAGITDSVDIDEITGGMTDEGFTADEYESCEYVGLIGENDTFKTKTKDGEEVLILVDHETGWISGMKQTSGGKEGELMDTVVHIYYDVDDTLEYDVTGAEDMPAEEAFMTLFGQFFMLLDLDEMAELPEVEG